ncbi:hypothetical protein V8E36_002063 [Tilletia maclaganii]
MLLDIAAGLSNDIRKLLRTPFVKRATLQELRNELRHNRPLERSWTGSPDIASWSIQLHASGPSATSISLCMPPSAGSVQCTRKAITLALGFHTWVPVDTATLLNDVDYTFEPFWHYDELDGTAAVAIMGPRGLANAS